MFLIVLFLIKQSYSEWRLIFSDFYQESLNAPNSIDYKASCTDNSDESVSIKNCGTNPLDYLRLKDDRTRMELALYYPHYQLRIITDVIYIRAKPGPDSEFKIYIKNSLTSTQLYSRLYQATDIQSYSDVCSYNCNSGCGSLDDTKIEIKTLVLDNINDQKDRFNISYCYTYQDSDMRIGLRNIFVYAKTCHFSCLTCQGSGQYDCLTCYNGALQGGLCVCNDEANSYIQLLTGCVQECNRNYYLADSQKYCQFDSRIQSYVDYFTSSTISNGNLIPYSPWIFTQDPFYSSNVNKIYACNGVDIVGKLSNYELMTLQLNENLSLKFLRIRVSFYLFNWQVGSKLRISVDNYEQSFIIKTATNYTFDSLSLVKFSSSSCSGSYDFLRIETVLNTQTTTPIIMFQGYTSLQTEYWGFRNITIDYGLCTSNCTECETYSRCKICDTNYLLYRGTCVIKCPPYTSILSNGTCEDYEDQIKNSRYLIKAFYDTNTTFEQVTNAVDNFTTSGDALQSSFTGTYNSFVPEKSVLGGVLVWKSGKFKKTFTSLSPHYKISYRMNVTYGDENPGWFKYIIGSDTSAQINNPNNGNYNSVGFSKNEATKYLEGLQRSHSNTQLDITLQADTMTASLADAFIYVSEYFVVVHYCAPFCLSCNGPEISDCNSGQYSGYSSTSYCASNQYLNFDSSTSIYTCINCPQLGCLQCQSQSVCTLCEYSTSNQFYLDSGTCKCYPSAYLSNPNCLQCNIYCETCFGSNIDQCYTCITEFHRSVYQNQCKCIPGYYDDDVSLECLPICGDQLIVDGEDCDDGNSNPFDGCDQCQFSCQDSCLDCQNGKCYECKDYFILIPSIYYCISNCGDNVVIDDEECEDGNNYPYDGCYLCKYQCYQNCIDCTKGVCNKCDETNGYYLTGSGCEPICGDGIIISGIEECDDQNFDPFDFCDACELGCSEFCEICSLGHCTKCFDGFQYNSKTRDCLPICRDYKIVGYEECDDNNFAILDGCYNCKFQCQQQCTDCQFGQCYECNYPGWEINLQTYLCETIMNDQIVTLNEQCDDGNNAPMDGCFEQYYECQDSCSVCYFDQCIRCKDYWYLNKQDHQCYPICGDGEIVGIEFCDDENTNVYDSCYQCNFICDKNCDKCFYGDCLECFDGFHLIQNKCIEICGDGLQVGQEQCDDNVIVIDKQECQQCQYLCNYGCQVCVKGTCEKCQTGYLLQDFDCIPICGDSLANGIEECDDGNDTPYDGCNECKFECQQECQNCQFNNCYDCQQGYLLQNYQCIDQCGNEIVTKNEDCDDGNLVAFDGCYNCKYSCDSECAICQYGRCYQCRALGLVINDVDNTCQPYCGDMIIIGNEQCDDGNDLSFDGCYECYFQCQDECTMCIEGECHQCNTIGWELVQHSCAPICGDSLIVGNEDCDDGNTIPYDGCYNCQYQCQEECTSCINGICKQCNTLGWNLISNSCQPHCGDGIIIDLYEQCDDGNDEQYDGCYQCSYQCQSICDDCIDGKCYSCSELGWVVDNYFCAPNCGDGLIVGNEQCDNGNIETDYCQNCKLICDKYCTDCDNGICSNCDIGRYLDNNECLTLCGDGILVQEDCDDGNLENGDGCSEKCLIEQDWICINTYLSTSSCFYSKSPQMKLELQTKNPENIEIVSINFNQPMILKYDENYTASHYFNGTIANLLTSQYLVQFDFQTKPLFSSATNVEVIATITFYENIVDPIFIVILNDTAIVSEQQNQVIDNEQQLKLRTPMVLSQGLKQSSESAKSFTNIVIYFMIALSGICILTGSFEMFWNLMDLLQYLSYIKYVNIQFPSNLNIYFEVFKLITIQPLMDATGVSLIFNSLDGDQKYIIQTSDKFQADEINGYFYTNFQSSIFCFVGLYGGYLIAKFGSQLLYQIGPYLVSLYGFYPGKVIYVVRNLLKQSQSEFYYNGILRMIMSNYYDISFSVFIQLINFNTSNTVFAVNSFAAILTFFAQLSFFSYMLVKLIAFTKTATVKKREQYLAIFEGVQESKDVWIAQYNSVLLLKKQIFIFLIVYMESDGPLQSICIAANQTIFLLYIIHLKPISNIYEYYKTLVAESLLSFNTLLFLAYAYKIELQLDVQTQYLIGWVHIAGFSFILVFSLLCDIIQQTQNIYRKIIKLFSSKNKTENEGTIIFY